MHAKIDGTMNGPHGRWVVKIYNDNHTYWAGSYLGKFYNKVHKFADTLTSRKIHSKQIECKTYREACSLLNSHFIISGRRSIEGVYREKIWYFDKIIQKGENGT